MALIPISVYVFYNDIDLKEISNEYATVLLSKRTESSGASVSVHIGESDAIVDSPKTYTSSFKSNPWVTSSGTLS